MLRAILARPDATETRPLSREDHVSYRAIFTAASHAQQAADDLHRLQPTAQARSV